MEIVNEANVLVFYSWRIQRIAIFNTQI